jgi:hypothetical protein
LILLPNFVLLCRSHMKKYFNANIVLLWFFLEFLETEKNEVLKIKKRTGERELKGIFGCEYPYDHITFIYFHYPGRAKSNGQTWVRDKQTISLSSLGHIDIHGWERIKCCEGPVGMNLRMEICNSAILLCEAPNFKVSVWPIF